MVHFYISQHKQTEWGACRQQAPFTRVSSGFSYSGHVNMMLLSVVTCHHN
jgi:hypothetical protein